MSEQTPPDAPAPTETTAPADAAAPAEPPAADDLRGFIAAWLPQLVTDLRGGPIDDLAAALGDESNAPPTTPEAQVQLVGRTLVQIAAWRSALAEAENDFQGFRDAWFGQPDREARRNLAEGALRTMRSERSTLVADLAALDRYMDFEAFHERHLRGQRRIQKRIEVATLFAAQVAAGLVARPETAYGVCLGLLENVKIDADLGGFAVHPEHPWGPRLQVLDALLALYRGLHRRGLFDRVSAVTLRRLLTLASDMRAHPFLRGNAIEVATLMPREEGRPILTRALAPRPGEPRDGFVSRRRVAEIVADRLPPRDAVTLLADRVWNGEESEHVRQGLAEIFARLASYGGLGPLRALAGRDPRTPESSPRVRAVAARYALAALLSSDPDDAVVGPLSKLCASVLRNEDDPLPLRLLAEDIGRAASSAPENMAPHTRRFRKAIDGRLADPGLPPPVIETLAWGRNRLDLAEAPEQQALARRIHKAARAVPEGGARTIEVPLDVETPAMRRVLGRAMADLSRRDLGLSARLRGRRITLWRGDRRGRRLWRILHELRRPSPTKRAGVSHTVGRVPRGELRAPPGRMDEEVPTTVPGERVRVRSEGGWARHLPTVDDLLAVAVSHRRPVHLFSDFGITTISPPRGMLRRLGNQLRLTWRYARMAELRLEALGGDENARRGRFVEAVRADYDVDIHFEPYDDGMPVPPHVASLFPGRAVPPSPALAREARAEEAEASRAGLGLLPLAVTDSESVMQALGDLFADSAAFLLSWAEGGQPALAIFLAGAVSWFVGRARYRQWRIARARKRLPLCIGGWGTRGKSGTERLKAALFHGLGYDVFVKTTGCEAMMMHSVPGRLPLEVFIHRPYDKATIWEQRDMLELAADMDAEVFLWECMALNPRYVSLLQHEWMRDDLVTLTNAYPDHEDIQGPAGEDVARVIAQFVPRHSTLLTSEDNFLPLFAETARQRGTRMLTTSALDAELIPRDLLDLFPYDEHPRNIGLVARLAAELGIDGTLAIHTMAQNVVPDLGVLKRYPEVRLRGRRVTFVNGMSANERAGFLANWRRTGLDEVSLSRSPRAAVVTVVNNRGDRVPRSEIFARILVEDVAADRHVLIGTNLAGLLGYIDTALNERLAEVRIVEASESDPQRPRRRLDAEMTRLRIPFPSQDALAARLEMLCDGLERRCRPERLDDALAAAGRWLTADGDQLDPAAVLAEVKGDLDWADALATLLDGPALTALDGPPEAMEQAELADAREAGHRLLAELAIHARLIRLVDRAVDGGLDPDAVNDKVRGAWRALFLERLEVVHNPEATGDQIIDRLARALPPGAHVTAMGIQNIKGTGLDFVYRWVNADGLLRLLEALDDTDEGQRIDALRAVANSADPGIVGAGTARARLAEHAERALSAEERGALDYARRRIEEQYRHLMDGLSASTERSPLARVLDRVEDGVDFVDAVRRTHKARRIVADLIGERISHDRAAVEMRALNKRGKGGWLARLFG